MLAYLQIRDFVLVDRLELELGPGLTVLTGETGAGKSILVDALSLVLGERASPSLVRQGRPQAEIAAVFDLAGLPEVAGWLEEQGLEAEGGECVLRRTLSAQGRSRAFVNGRPVPLQTLQALGRRLVDLHGQHAHQALLSREGQRRVLDAFAGALPLAAETAARWRAWRAAREALEARRKGQAEREERLDFLRYQLRELEELAPGEGEAEALEEEHRRLAHGGRLLEGTQAALALLEDEGGAVEAAGRAGAKLERLAGHDPALREPAGLLEEARIRLEESAAWLRRYADGLDLDPERLAWVEERLARLQALARKHRVAVGELPARLEALRRELAEAEDGTAGLEALRRREREAREAYEEAAARLGAARREAAPRLQAAVEEALQGLGMEGARFRIGLEARPEPGASGREQVAFLVAANPGQEPGPLAQVASGGELARIALAVQVVSAGGTGVPCLVFDEVDVGVGGRVAERVGRRLRELGRHRQVLCVTHLPQVAAQGHHHLQVIKETAAAEALTRLRPLEGAARCEELARMLAGEEITAWARAHARELLERAAAAP